ncbi:MAG TPA: diaminopimelate dehydrogenase [Halanaerobiaceae bacterium]|nr:diaminopimelate dehydrogenase [Halanaerobiaceae bacterium]HOA39810.1 diaminopimelate dehydrogenase [Halanaerobiales bacterium]HPZ62598.1 diaminopimelate dehydrogenase [Halanaerobiales bacterium]HQD03867.1 diaminopimelate dehydrogenase [Halanaerobiales bacterium]
MERIRVAIVGYGNLGRGVEKAIKKSPDMELIAVFSRRPAAALNIKDEKVAVYNIADAEKYVDEIDVAILCGGSATDLPVQGPQFVRLFNTVDSFDTHARIPEYYETMERAGRESGHLAAISIGWDPGLFSLNRLLLEAVLPAGSTYTFWGRGVSQGHSDAIRRIAGVKNAVQYTIPVAEAIERVRKGENPQLSTREKHIRECYVVVEEGADQERITREIKEMPAYFADYDTEVIFISEEELERNHSAMPHGGFVIRSGETGEGHKQLVEFSLQLENNPEFTGSVLLAYARAVYRLNKEGERGAKTVFDIPLAYIYPGLPAALREKLL